MTAEKLKKILGELDGISYLDWVKLRHAVDMNFNADIHLMSNAMPLRDTDKVFKEITRY